MDDFILLMLGFTIGSVLVLIWPRRNHSRPPEATRNLP